MSVVSIGGTRAQFSVIARLRPGHPCSLSTYEIIGCITKHLEACKSIFNVAFSPPNFIVHLPTLEAQLQILTNKTLVGADYTLDILPWCSEYISKDLPWIPTSIKEDVEAHLELHQPARNDASDHPIHSPMNAGIDCCTNCPTNPTRGAHFQHNKGYICVCQNLLALPGQPDFSSLILAEIREFYKAKVEAFEACRETCKQIGYITQQFSIQLDRAIDAVYQQTTQNNQGFVEATAYHLQNFSGDLKHQMWFVSEEAFGLQFDLHSVYQENNHARRLNIYNGVVTAGQIFTPVTIGPLLKAMAQMVVAKIYNTTVIIHTDCNSAQEFDTHISADTFHHTYRSPVGTNKPEAEANALYRFLKHITNTLGYLIVDTNWGPLSAAIGHLNDLAASVSHLHSCIKTGTELIKKTEEAIQEIYDNLKLQVEASDIPHVQTTADDLILLLRGYSETAANITHLFQEQKATFRSIKFSSTYKARSD